MIICRNIMNYADFRQNFQNLPLILSKDVIRGKKDPQIIRNQLNRWHKSGKIICLRKGMYVLNDQDRRPPFNLCHIANRLYEPSYVSCEYALSYYGFIPEGVWTLTSVTTRKTQRFKNKFAHFDYRHIKAQAFRGFKQVGEDGYPIFMAEPEKAIVDFVYFKLSNFGKNDRDVFENSYRFDSLEDLNYDRLMELGDLFQNKKLMRVLTALEPMIAKWK